MPVDQSSSLPAIGTVIGGTYELKRFLGKGGMGAVYEALTIDKQRVALKVLLEGSEQQKEAQAVARFKREAQVIAALNDPHIVPLLDYGLDGPTGASYIVMPILIGTDLQNAIRRLAPIHPITAVRITRQICQALQATHAAGVIHRDIKPANLFLDQDPQGRIMVKVLDFGVAKWATGDTSLTKTGVVIGTPHYSSPEQFTDSRVVDQRADVWSVGTVLYHMLSGQLPLGGGKTAAEMYISVLRADVPLIQKHAPWIDPGLATIVHGALLRDMNARCPSVKEFASALLPYANGSDDLAANMLISVPDSMRDTVSQQIELPRQWMRVDPSKRPPALPKQGADKLLGKTLGGKFTLMRRLGAGGMATVFEASDENGDRVALKVITPETAMSTPDSRARFMREAKATAAIHHENVVRVIEAGLDEELDQPYIAMELLLGDDLQTHIKQRGALSSKTAAKLFLQACNGLATAHGLGLVHRDIKPANLFLHEQPDGRVIVKICDFGLVKRFLATDDTETTAHLTRLGGIIGSPQYMSPEQAKQSVLVDHRSDIWSLGVSLYHALTGRRLWHNCESVGELLVAICTAPIPNVQDAAPWVSPQLAEAVSKALQREPEKRFQSVAEFARALAPACGNDPRLGRNDLASVSPEEKSFVAPRASILDTVGAVSGTVPDFKPQRTKFWMLAAGGAVITISVVGAAITIGGNSHSVPVPSVTALPEAAPTVVPSESPPVKETRKVELTVIPKTAKVTINDVEQTLVGGKLVYEAEVGDRLKVKVTDGKREREESIFIGNDEKIPPTTIDLTKAVIKRPVSNGSAGGPATTQTGTDPTPTVKPPPSTITRENWD